MKCQRKNTILNIIAIDIHLVLKLNAVCGICGSNYAHRISGNQKGKQYFYWPCYNKVTLKEKCPESLTIREDILKKMLIEVYNSITTQKHKTRDKLINAIKEIITNEDNKKELSKLHSEVQTL